MPDPMLFEHALCTAAGVRERLAAFSLAPNKALGQNFLVNNMALTTMMESLGDVALPVLEIGPGLGTLTEALLHHGIPRIAAVEKDVQLALALNRLLPDERLHVIEGDILRVDLPEIHTQLGGGPLFVAGNLPYYITTPILLRLMDCGLPVAGMLLMMQLEASRRLFAQPGNEVYGPLSIVAGIAYQCQEVLTLPPSSYFPQPGVQSAVVLLSRKAELPAGFLAFLQRVFAMRRKTLLNNLLAMGFSRADIEQKLAVLATSPGVRAESLPPDKLLSLFLLFCDKPE